MERIDIIAEFYNKCKKRYGMEVFTEFEKIHDEIRNMIKYNYTKYTKVLIIDLTISKPKYGEVIAVMQTCNVLNKLGYEVKLYIFKRKEIDGHVFEAMIKNDRVMMSAYRDIERIAGMLVKSQGMKCKVVEDKELQRTILENKSGQVLFSNTIKSSNSCTRKQEYAEIDNFFALNQKLLSILFVQFCSFLKGNSKIYLVGDILKEQSSKDGIRNLITTNFRFNKIRPSKNGQVATIINAAEYFYKKVSYQTMVLTCKDGQNYLKKHSQVGNSIVFGSPGKFIEESKLLINSAFYHQVQGGGIGVWPLFSSSIPYTVLCDPGCLIPYKSRSLFAISETEKQVFLTSRECTFQEYWKNTKDMAIEILSR